MNKPITFPPLLWLSVLVPAAAWVQESFPFPEYPWSPAVVVVIGAVIKLIQTYWPESKEVSNDRMSAPVSRAWRLWIGG